MGGRSLILCSAAFRRIRGKHGNNAVMFLVVCSLFDVLIAVAILNVFTVVCRSDHDEDQQGSSNLVPRLVCTSSAARARVMLEVGRKPQASNYQRMALSRHFLAATVLFLAFSSVHTMAQWRLGQRPARMLHSLTLQESSQIAGLTDMKTFYRQLKPILVPRIVNTVQHRQVAEHIHSELARAGFQVFFDEFTSKTPYGSVPFRNIIATFDPHAPRRLVLACHYDSKILPGKVFIAATDSAVPCAMLLDFARTLGPLLRAQTDLHATLQLVFLDGEEAFVEWTRNDSTYGARHLAEIWSKKWYPTASPQVPLELSMELDRVDAFVLLDLLGAPRPQITHTLGHGTKALFEAIESTEKVLKSAGRLRNIPPIFSSFDSYHAVEDDHIPFLEKGVPVMHLISVPFPSVWHTPKDDESALDWNTIYNLLSTVRVFTAEYLGLKPEPSVQH